MRISIYREGGAGDFIVSADGVIVDQFKDIDAAARCRDGVAAGEISPPDAAEALTPEKSKPAKKTAAKSKPAKE